MTLILIDNYDSFTWNIYQYLCILGAKVHVFRNDQVTISHLQSLNPTHLVISPGPGHPSTDSGISKPAISHFAGQIPILGICLGMQCMYELYGGTISHAGEIAHGKASNINHNNQGIFSGVRKDALFTRYHSLAGLEDTLPDCLEITARTSSGVIMGVRHRQLCIEGVQFHPESILSEDGKMLLENFLKMKDGKKTEVTQSILMRIKEQRILDVQKEKSLPGNDQLESLLFCAPPAVDFYYRLKQSSHVALIAEIKRASPSKGIINASINAGVQAYSYATSGVSAISVLTEPKWFLGKMQDMQQARMAVEGLRDRPAILLKDFVVDKFQIVQARINGADSVLLIVAILSDKLLSEFIGYSRELGMEPLVEVNSEAEMKRAVKLGAKIIGVNNRNLHSFNVDMNTTSSLASLVPDECILCALSGITDRKDIEAYIPCGVKAVLVGESIMRAESPQKFISELINCSPKDKKERQVLVKICGIQTVEAAVAAVNVGADFIGLIFAESRRKVSTETAKQIIETVKSLKTHSFSEDFSQTRKPLVVGVFLNQPFDYIYKTTVDLELDLIQLHGDEQLEFAKYLPRPVIRAFHISSDISKVVEASIKRRDCHQISLLDAKLEGKAHQGGHGTVFNWELTKNFSNVKFILAGGLCVENVVQAIQKTGAWAVDVSSGVERNGIKNTDLITAFVSAAKSVKL